MKVVIVGAGGHAHWLANILEQSREAGGEWEIVGFQDDDQALWGSALMGYPVLGSLNDLELVNRDAVLLAVGDNRQRAGLYERLVSKGERILSVFHPTSIVAKDAIVGTGVVASANVVIGAGVKIGDNVILNTGCIVGHNSVVGDHAHVSAGATVGGAVTIGEGTLVGLGANVLSGYKIGAWSVVGAGAAVVSDIPEAVTAYGVPARFRV